MCGRSALALLVLTAPAHQAAAATAFPSREPAPQVVRSNAPLSGIQRLLAPATVTFFRSHARVWWQSPDTGEPLTGRFLFAQPSSHPPALALIERDEEIGTHTLALVPLTLLQPMDGTADTLGTFVRAKWEWLKLQYVRCMDPQAAREFGLGLQRARR